MWGWCAQTVGWLGRTVVPDKEIDPSRVLHGVIVVPG